MKKAIYCLAILAFLISTVGCDNNMKRDVKRLSHKTEQCFSMIDVTNPDVEPSEEFNECYSEMEKLMEKYSKKYSGEKESNEFGRMYIEELRKSDLPQEFINLYNFLYELSEQ